jgi:large subunit ribosomal protein L20
VPRVKRGTHRKDARKKTLKQASGYFLTKSKLNRAAQEAVERGLKFAYVGRKNKKRDFRSLFIVRINAACRLADLSYSKFMHGLKLAGVDLNRKVLAELANQDESAFRLLAEKAKAEGRALGIGLHGNAAEVFPAALELGWKPDIVTEMCPCHDPISYIALGHTVAEAEAAVAEAETRVEALRARLEDPALYTSSDGPREAARLGAELEGARTVLERAFARWEAASTAAEQRA